MPADTPLAKTVHTVEPSVVGGASHLPQLAGTAKSRSKGRGVGRGENWSHHCNPLQVELL